MPTLKTSLLMFLLIAVAGCATKLERALHDLPCYSGWASRGGDEIVELWEPNPEAIESITPKQPTNRTIGCWLRYPSGRVLVLSADNEGHRWSTEYAPVSNGFAKESDDVLITVR